MGKTAMPREELIKKLKEQPTGDPPKQQPWADYVAPLSDRQIEDLVDDPRLRGNYATLAEAAYRNDGPELVRIFRGAQKL